MAKVNLMSVCALNLLQPPTAYIFSSKAILNFSACLIPYGFHFSYKHDIKKK